jgi:hypothetical protein
LESIPEIKKAFSIANQMYLTPNEIDDRHQTQISALEITQLEELAEALLNFASITDLEFWLENIFQSDRLRYQDRSPAF